MDKFINYLFSKNIKVQFGHSLADSKCCEKYIDQNISFTHLYNAMSGNNHRKPGVLSAALSRGLFAEIICDMYHVSKEAILIAKKCIPNLYAITDSIAASGMKDGNYTFANVKIKKYNNKALLEDEKTLAGSIVNMHDIFLNLLKMKISLNDAVKMTSYSAAKFINQEDIGYIEVGKKSNFLVLDNNLNLSQIYLNGELVNE